MRVLQKYTGMKNDGQVLSTSGSQPSIKNKARTMSV
jgi:hypothetical protein